MYLMTDILSTVQLQEFWSWPNRHLSIILVTMITILKRKMNWPQAYAGVSSAPSDVCAPEPESQAKLSWQEQKEAQAKERKRQNELKKTEERITELEERDGEIDELMVQEEIYTNSVKCQELATGKI